MEIHYFCRDALGIGKPTSRCKFDSPNFVHFSTNYTIGDSGMSRTHHPRVKTRQMFIPERARRKQQKRRDRQIAKLELLNQTGKLPPPKSLVQILRDELGEESLS